MHFDERHQEEENRERKGEGETEYQERGGLNGVMGIHSHMFHITTRILPCFCCLLLLVYEDGSAVSMRSFSLTFSGVNDWRHDRFCVCMFVCFCV